MHCEQRDHELVVQENRGIYFVPLLVLDKGLSLGLKLINDACRGQTDCAGSQREASIMPSALLQSAGAHCSVNNAIMRSLSKEAGTFCVPLLVRKQKARLSA